MTTGHLFIGHGRLEKVAYDAAIVPVGREFHVREYWQPLFGRKKPRPPADWDGKWWGRAPNDPSVWFVSIGGDRSDRIDIIVDRAEAVLREVSLAAAPPRGGRPLPLVVVPVLGIRGGGLGRQRGDVIRTLVERLSRAAQGSGVDVLIQTPDPAVYAALQYARRKTFSALSTSLEQHAQELAQLAGGQRLALFLGAGVSIPAGLPSWAKLIETLAEEAPGITPDDLTGLNAIDQADLIERAMPDAFAKRVVTLAKSAKQPSLIHVLLAGLDSRQVVTTNYDRLYERAVKATGRRVASVMPWTSPLGADRWILKLHGDVEHPELVVLTRHHMVRYDAQNRPSAALLQSLFLTKHVLVVGASLEDDNVIRLAHEVQAYRDAYQAGGQTFGTVLSTGKGQVRARLWNKQLDWVHLDGGSVDPGVGRRMLEIFLDRVGFLASRDSSWLLDDRFEGLLADPADRRIAREVRKLYDDLPKHAESKWSPLVTALERLGARGES